MATDVAGQRRRAWYAALLRLYPRPFHDRFVEEMAQAFHDLCRERRNAKRGLVQVRSMDLFRDGGGNS